VDLTLLAESVDGVEPMSERDLRRAAHAPSWIKQHVGFMPE
jgi:hypothetical protein